MTRTAVVAVGLFMVMASELRAGTEDGWDASMRMFMTDAVRRTYLSAQIADIGREQSDPLLLITAARLKAWAGGRKYDFRPHLEYGAVAFEKQPGMPPRPIDHSPDGLLAEARMEAAGNQHLLAMVETSVDQTKREVARTAHSGPNFQQLSLPPCGRATFQIKYYRGGAAAAIVGSWVSKLDLVVRDRAGKVVCEARDWVGHQLCEWNVERTADYELIVENPGARADEFRLYVN